MKLVKDPNKVAVKHTAVSEERRKQIIDHLRSLTPAEIPSVRETIINNGAPEAEKALVNELLGIATPKPKKTSGNK